MNKYRMASGFCMETAAEKALKFGFGIREYQFKNVSNYFLFLADDSRIEMDFVNRNFHAIYDAHGHRMASRYSI